MGELQCSKCPRSGDFLHLKGANPHLAPHCPHQSTLRPPEVHIFYRKIELCIIRMGDDMHVACTHEQEMVDHVIPELQDKVTAWYN